MYICILSVDAFVSQRKGTFRSSLMSIPAITDGLSIKPI